MIPFEQGFGGHLRGGYGVLKCHTLNIILRVCMYYLCEAGTGTVVCPLAVLVVMILVELTRGSPEEVVPSCLRASS